MPPPATLPRENEAAPPRLITSGLSKHFGGVTAIDSLHLAVAPGELVAVVGPNGAGKSTLFQLISGVIRADSGSVRLGEHELVGQPPEAIAALGVGRTFQTSRVFPALSVWDSVRVGQTVSLTRGTGTRRQRNPIGEIALALVRPRSFTDRERALDAQAEATLQLFGERLWPRRHDRADSLSYANRRRLEIARALVDKPTLLLLDEPTAGMNPTETAELADLVARLHEERPDMSVILVEHKLDVVRNLASRVVVLDRGQKLVEGSADLVLSDHRVIEAYLGRAGPSRTDARPEGHGDG